MSNEQQPDAGPPLILAIETATRTGSVSVARGEKVLASVSGDPSSSHSTDLIESVNTVLRDAGAELTAVELLAAAIGPGSFTGLRIGLATVKSFAVALNRRCAAVPTLAAVAYAAGKSERTVALLPAGRGEVFAQMFSVSDNVARLDEPSHISPVQLIAKYGAHPRVLWAGEGAHIQSDVLRQAAAKAGFPFDGNGTAHLSNGWMIASPPDRLADAVAMLALRQWREGSLVGPEDLRANYVRPSDAEIKSNV